MPRPYGWRRDQPDTRDYSFAPVSIHLPATVDLRPKCPPVYDQGQLGSCTANAIAAAIDCELIRQKRPGICPSRLFIYYNERVIENTVQEDAGAELRDGIKSVAKQGAAPESAWRYDIGKFAVQPPAAAYTAALAHQVQMYLRLNQNLSEMKTCLASGFPFVFGFTVYESFESAAVESSGVLNLPATGEQPVGGHAVLCVGYDDTRQRFLIRNSWGESWGQRGYFTMPYAYLANPGLANDFWTIRLVES